VETPEYWPKIKEIFGAALERAPGERGPFLDQACERQPAQALVPFLHAGQGNKISGDTLTIS
jgi:hypothetical protein